MGRTAAVRSRRAAWISAVERTLNRLPCTRIYSGGGASDRVGIWARAGASSLEAGLVQFAQRVRANRYLRSRSSAFAQWAGDDSDRTRTGAVDRRRLDDQQLRARSAQRYGGQSQRLADLRL